MTAPLATQEKINKNQKIKTKLKVAFRQKKNGKNISFDSLSKDF
jgi:hypothetical protein